MKETFFRLKVGIFDPRTEHHYVVRARLFAGKNFEDFSKRESCLRLSVFLFFSVFNDPFSFYYHLIPPPASNIHTCIRKEVHFLLESPIQNITIWFGDESRTLALEI